MKQPFIKTSIGPVLFGEGQMPVNWRDHSVSTPEILRGKPRIKGTRTPRSIILGYFAAGWTTDDIIVEFHDLKTMQIPACLDYARDLVDKDLKM